MRLVETGCTDEIKTVITNEDETKAATQVETEGEAELNLKLKR